MFCFYHLINKQEKLVNRVIVILVGRFGMNYGEFLFIIILSVGFLINCATSFLWQLWVLLDSSHEIVTDGLLLSTGAEKNSTN